jgi:hypothetical protein
MPAVRVRQSKSVVAMAVHFDFFFALSAASLASRKARKRAVLAGHGVLRGLVIVNRPSSIGGEFLQ